MFQTNDSNFLPIYSRVNPPEIKTWSAVELPLFKTHFLVVLRAYVDDEPGAFMDTNVLLSEFHDVEEARQLQRSNGQQLIEAYLLFHENQEWRMGKIEAHLIGKSETGVKFDVIRTVDKKLHIVSYSISKISQCAMADLQLSAEYPSRRAKSEGADTHESGAE